MPSISRRLATSTPSSKGGVGGGPTLTLSNMTATVENGKTTVVVSVECTSDIVNVTLTEGSAYGTKVAPDDTPSGGVASWTVTTLSPGTYTLYTVGYNKPSGVSGGQNSAPVSVSVTIPQTSGQSTPTASFSYTANNLTVQFTDQSTDQGGTISSYSWNFGDGKTSTSRNPSHTYASAGTYTVTETVTDNNNQQASISHQVQASSSGGGGGGTGVALAAAPTGPAVPAQGWTVAFGDTFSNGVIDTNFWVPNRCPMANINQNQLGDNGNNNEYFNASQVTCGSDGLSLTCEYKVSGQNDGAGNPIDYLSGYITTQHHSGWAPTGFSWQADTTTMWAFEIVCTLPPTSYACGSDWNFWTTDNPTWSIEIDFFEIWGWTPKSGGQFFSMTPITWIYNTGGNGLVQEAYYSNSGPAMPAAVTDGLEHRWTWLFNPSTRRVQPYIDGSPLGAGIAYPSSFTNGQMCLIAEAATRVDTSVTATRVYKIRSIGAYYRTGDSAKFQGGGLAAGTTVA